MEINFLAIVVASTAQFICGAVWYSALFGKLWGKIHGFDKLSKDVQQKMMKEMGPYYGVQFLVTVLMAFVLALLMSVLPKDWSAFKLAGLLWLGFIVPTQVSSVIFGGTQGKWIVKKIAVQAGAALLCLEVGAGVLQLFS